MQIYAKFISFNKRVILLKEPKDGGRGRGRRNLEFLTNIAEYAWGVYASSKHAVFLV